MRGTFANIRLRNQLAPGAEGGWTRHLPDGEQMTHLRRGDALPATKACRWSSSPGKEYGTGSSRDWAAKGTTLLGVRAVIAESFERIHRSNLVGMGVLPLQFEAGRTRAIARAHRRGDVRHRGHRRRADAREAADGAGARRRRRGEDVHRRLPHRHAGRGRLLPPRRHPAVRAAAAGGVELRVRSPHFTVDVRLLDRVLEFLNL